MPTNQLSLYKNHTETVAFDLATCTEDGARYVVAGRQLNQPFYLEVRRKLTPSASKGNDRVSVTIGRTDKNTSTSQLATGTVQCVISVPKDNSIIGRTEMEQLVSLLRSALDDSTVRASTCVNIDALLDGRDL